ncbi:MAG: hypothetical protein KF866_05100 [Phycisphaeraceae bacterium]|nr:hypothetical protein [Phycisphaeraceae bacterium]
MSIDVTLHESTLAYSEARVVLVLPGSVIYDQYYYESGSDVFVGAACNAGFGELRASGAASATIDWYTSNPVNVASADYEVHVVLRVTECECVADWNCDGMLDASDFYAFLDSWVSGNLCDADITGSADPNDPSYGVPDNIVDANDFYYYLDLFTEGCM